MGNRLTINRIHQSKCHCGGDAETSVRQPIPPERINQVVYRHRYLAVCRACRAKAEHEREPTLSDFVLDRFTLAMDD